MNFKSTTDPDNIIQFSSAQDLMNQINSLWEPHFVNDIRFSLSREKSDEGTHQWDVLIKYQTEDFFRHAGTSDAYAHLNHPTFSAIEIIEKVVHADHSTFDMIRDLMLEESLLYCVNDLEAISDVMEMRYQTLLKGH